MARSSAGKAQAEAYLARDGSLPLVVPRLAHYVELARRGPTLDYGNADAAQDFITPHAAAHFLAWAGLQDFGGAVNAGCEGALPAAGLYRRVGKVLELPVRLRRVTRAAPGVRSPFDLPTPMLLDTARARGLGYRFDHSDEWLDDVIRQHDLAHV